MNPIQLKVGDKIVDFGRVYRIFKIENNLQDNTVIHFKPYFKSKKDGGMTCSIPINNINKTRIRRPINKERMHKILKKLSSKKIDEDINILEITEAKEVLGINKATKTANILKKLWLEKQDESKNFTKSKETAFKHLIERLSEEIAYAGSTTLENAEAKIRNALKKSL